MNLLLLPGLYYVILADQRRGYKPIKGGAINDD